VRSHEYNASLTEMVFPISPITPSTSMTMTRWTLSCPSLGSTACFGQDGFIPTKPPIAPGSMGILPMCPPDKSSTNASQVERQRQISGDTPCSTDMGGSTAILIILRLDSTAKRSKDTMISSGRSKSWEFWGSTSWQVLL